MEAAKGLGFSLDWNDWMAEKIGSAISLGECWGS